MTQYIIFLISISLMLISSYAVAQPLFFDNNTEIRIQNAYYEVALSKTNGCITRIIDRSTGQVITSGTSDGHLWHADLFNGRGIGGADYERNSMGGNRFSYRWFPAKQQLELNYSADKSDKTALNVRIIATFTDQRYFDLEGEVDNRSGERMLRVDIPHALHLNAGDMQEAFFPVLPGIRFNKRFFEEKHSWNNGHYPRNTVFADYAHFGLSSGQLTTYSVLKEDVTPIVRRALTYDSGSYLWRHAYQVATADGSTWKSPKVRILVGAELPESINAYRNDTGLAATPSLRSKLGELYDRVTSALSTKWDVFSILYEFQYNLKDKESYAALWKSLPGPSLLFICNYPRGGQDRSNPDIFPIDPKLGTDEDFRAVLELARQQKHLIMPYVNPSFWDENSETAKSLRVGDFAAMYEEGVPRREGYDGRYGYAVTPQAPAVQDRLRRLIQELTTKLPVDLIWEDQVGSRYDADYNPHSPNPALHAQGWLEHTRRYQHLKLMAEHGYDRQVASHVGFQGNLLLYERGGDFGDSDWGKGTWEYYPIVPMMARDKILFYNAPDHYVRSKRMLTWALAMGQMPSYDIHKSTLNTPWHKITSLMQQHVLSRFANKRLTQYEVQSEDVTVSHFDEWQVVANLSAISPHAVGKHVVVPEGFLIMDKSGSITAGVFKRFNGMDLSEGDHYLIVIRDSNTLVIYQPQGEDTPITLDLSSTKTPVEWRVSAVAGSQKIEVPFEVDGHQIKFSWKRIVNDKKIDRYEIHAISSASR